MRQSDEVRGSRCCIRRVYAGGPRVRARPCCFTHASRVLRKETGGEGERGRRARAVPERPRSFLSYPENRSLRHAALDDRQHACTGDHGTGTLYIDWLRGCSSLRQTFESCRFDPSYPSPFSSFVLSLSLSNTVLVCPTNASDACPRGNVLPPAGNADGNHRDWNAIRGCSPVLIATLASHHDILEKTGVSLGR